MAADIAPRVAKPSVDMVLTMQDKCTIVSHGDGFQLPDPSQC